MNIGSANMGALNMAAVNRGAVNIAAAITIAAITPPGNRALGIVRGTIAGRALAGSGVRGGVIAPIACPFVPRRMIADLLMGAAHAAAHFAARAAVPSRIARQMTQPVQCALQDIACRHLVDDLCAPRARGIGLQQGTFGGHG